MIIIMGSVRIDPARLAAAREAMAAMVAGSRAEAGCFHYAYAEDLLEPGLIRVSEQWADQAAVDYHFNTPHMAAWRARWPELGLHDRQLQLIESRMVRAL